MPIGLKIEVKSAQLEERLQTFLAGLTDRRPLHDSLGERGRELTRSHLVAIAQTRHDTADRLGARRTGHWAQAAEKTTFAADGDGATVSVVHPGIGRAGHDVEIFPTPPRKYLTIPAIAAAYGQRAYRETDLIFARIGPKQTPVLFKKGEGEKFGTVWYWLVRSVRQKQDRTLLPADEEYRLAALEGVRDFVDRLLG